MKKAILFALTAIGFMLLPYTKAQAQAQVFDYHYDYYSYNYYYACGNYVFAQGTISSDYHYVYNKNRAHVSGHTSGDLTAWDYYGNTYDGKVSSRYSSNYPIQNGAFTYTNRYSVRFVSRGGTAPDFTMIYTSKYTVNANGEVTVDRYDYETSCD